MFQRLRRLEAGRDPDRFLPPELSRTLERGGELPKGRMERKHFQFVLINLDDTAPDELPVLISSVVTTLMQHKATLSSITSSLVVGFLGIPFPKSDSPEARRALVKALLAENGNSLRIAHGQCDGMVGLFGVEGNFRYDGIIPGFSRILRELLDRPFGSAAEIA